MYVGFTYTAKVAVRAPALEVRMGGRARPGVVGPGDGAKPREVYLHAETPGEGIQINTGEEGKKDDEWDKV